MVTTKGQRTRQHVIEAAAPVFNQKGYWGASMRDVLDATGLEKGGIYNHFASKDELAIAALDHNTTVVGDGIRAALHGRFDAVERLEAFVEFYRAFAHDFPVPGGCPLLNASADSDDTHPELRARAQEIFGDLIDGTVGRIVERGVERGQLQPDTDPQAVSSIVVSSIEGALLLTHLYDDPSHADRVADHLITYVRSLAAEETPS
jgi:TetR/AcrR family transcriptional regulator, transcriptional repressor for nem operon